VSISGQPPSFDPAAADLGEAAYIWTGLYDTLLKVDVDGAIQPNAAEKWEYSEDGLTLTLTLREDLTFSDDSAITAEDVAATIERSRTSSGLRTPDLALVTSVEASDERTVVLTLSEGDPALLVNLATGAGIIAEASDLKNECIALSPLESGPYVLDDEATSTGATYALNRRDDYWNADAYPYETVTVRVIEDPQARFNALQAGELDAGTVTANQVSAMEAAGFTAKSTEAQAWGGLVFLDRKGELVPALGDERVRTAIAMAFDRDLYVKQLLQGAGRTTDQILNPIQAGYSADLEGHWKYDPDAAKALLAEAGYADGIDLVMPSSYFSTRFEPAITQSLADIGVRVRWEAGDPGAGAPLHAASAAGRAPAAPDRPGAEARREAAAPCPSHAPPQSRSGSTKPPPPARGSSSRRPSSRTPRKQIRPIPRDPRRRTNEAFPWASAPSRRDPRSARTRVSSRRRGSSGRGTGRSKGQRLPCVRCDAALRV